MAGRRWSLRSLVGPALGLSVVLLVLGCVFAFPGYIVDRDLDGPSSALAPAGRLEATNDVRATLLQGLAGLFFLATAFFTWRQIRVSQQQLRVSEDQQIAERLTRAIDQLGSRSCDVRIGGIYSLERIGRDRESDFEAIAEILTAFVREHAPLVDPEAPVAQGKPAADVQAVLAVLGGSPGPSRRLDLSGVDLTGANLREAQLDRVVLNGSRLANADLFRAHLNRALLVGADLRRARVEQAELRGARLIDAKLQGLRAAGADLRDALLTGSRVNGARLVNVQLEGATLTGVNLREARHGGLRYDTRTKWPVGYEPKEEEELPPPAAAPV